MIKTSHINVKWEDLENNISQNWGAQSIFLYRIYCMFPVTPHVNYLITASQQRIRAVKLTSTPFDREETKAQNGCITYPRLCNFIGPSFQCGPFLNPSLLHPVLHTLSSHSGFCRSPDKGGLVHFRIEHSSILRAF